MTERRKYHRSEKTVEVKYQSRENPAVKDYTISDNISRGGISMPVSDAVKNGETLELWMRFNKTIGPFSALGRVVWSNRIGRPSYFKQRVGVEFTSIDEEKAELLP